MTTIVTIAVVAWRRVSPPDLIGRAFGCPEALNGPVFKAVFPDRYESHSRACFKILVTTLFSTLRCIVMA